MHAADILRKQLLAPNYQCKPVALGANTDPYKPIERHYTITRAVSYTHLTLPTKA